MDSKPKHKHMAPLVLELRHQAPSQSQSSEVPALEWSMSAPDPSYFGWVLLAGGPWSLVQAVAVPGGMGGQDFWWEFCTGIRVSGRDITGMTLYLQSSHRES